MKETMPEVFSIALLCMASVYALFLLWCIIGWSRMKGVALRRKENIEPVSVSVIIPVRDEAETIQECIKDFSVMDYPKNAFEILVVDDHSSDTTVQLVRDCIRTFPSLQIRLMLLSEGYAGKMYKKQSITEAVDKANGELLVTTDADCRRGTHWLRQLADCYRDYRLSMISAPVLFMDEKNWFERMQSLEFLGLVAIGAASIGNGKPLLCNGANLAFTKNVFLETGGYSSGKPMISGDDTQLLAKVSQKGSGAIRFLKSRDAVVTTRPQSSLRGLLSQRKRWASKIPRQMSFFTAFIASVAFLLHIGLVIAAIGVALGEPWRILVFPLILKMVPEFILLASTASFFKKAKLLFLFLPAQVLYPFYIAVVGIASLNGNYSWKGRQIK